MARRGNGRLSKRLIEMLAAKGYKANYITPAQGYWCSSNQADVYRWETQVVCPDGIERPLGCWDTMTQCVSRGFAVVADSANTLEAHVLEAK